LGPPPVNTGRRETVVAKYTETQEAPFMRASRGRNGEDPRCMQFEISIWKSKDWKEGDPIQIGHNENEGPSTFRTSVVPDASKSNGHPKLYRELSKILAMLPSTRAA